MTALTVTIPVRPTSVPLGAIAVPARGRRPVTRYLYGTTVPAEAPDLARFLGEQLRAFVGPTRCTAVAVQSATGRPAIDRTLAELATRPEVGAAQVRKLDVTITRVEASLALAGLDVPPVLLFALCGTLWVQPARLAFLS